MKKAIAKISAAIHIRRKPMPMMVRHAPISSSSPVVENNPTFVFADRCLSERLVKKAETIANIQRITRTAIIAAMKGATSEKVILFVLAFMPENDEMVDQLPFQSG